MATAAVTAMRKPSASVTPTLLDELLQEGLAIQHRFAADPVYSRSERGSGRGFLLPSGVNEIAEAKLRESSNTRKPRTR